MSLNDAEWGVTPKRAQDTFGSFQAQFGRDDLALHILSLNQIPFGLYEDAVCELDRRGAVIAIGVDYSGLRRVTGGGGEARPAYHLVRLTPLGGEDDQHPTIRSGGFGFDYGGEVQFFDDSGEIGLDDSRLCWRDLIRACRSIDGAFWAVRPIEQAPVSPTAQVL